MKVEREKVIDYARNVLLKTGSLPSVKDITAALGWRSKSDFYSKTGFTSIRELYEELGLKTSDEERFKKTQRAIEARRAVSKSVVEQGPMELQQISKNINAIHTQLMEYVLAIREALRDKATHSFMVKALEDGDLYNWEPVRSFARSFAEREREDWMVENLDDLEFKCPKCGNKTYLTVDKTNFKFQNIEIYFRCPYCQTKQGWRYDPENWETDADYHIILTKLIGCASSPYQA